MIELEDALQRILSHVSRGAIETVSVASAAGRYAVEEIRSPRNLPPFDNSAMDGYAVRSADVKEASQETPARLSILGKVAAGQAAERIEVSPGTCVRLFTGSPLPEGADAVVMQEDTSEAPGNANAILVREPVRPWENVRFQGEDLKTGAPLLNAGCPLNAGHLAALGATGIGRISVVQRPTVGLLSTGSELKEPGEPLQPGEIHESNRWMLAELTRQAGGVPAIDSIVRDDPESTRAALRRALAANDLVVSTGGVSVGEFDFIKSAFQEIGGALDLWRVRIKPGKPFAWGRLNGKNFFGLPGNPVSAFVTFLLFVRPVILKLQGARDVGLPVQRGALKHELQNPANRRHFIRVFINPEGEVSSAGAQASHRISSLAASNGLVDLPPETNWPAGHGVDVFRWR